MIKTDEAKCVEYRQRQIKVMLYWIHLYRGLDIEKIRIIGKEVKYGNIE